MKRKIIQIGGNLKINGISSFIMENYRNLNNDYEFIFINTADDEDGFYKDEILNLGGKVYNIHSKGKGLLRALRQAKKIRKIIEIEKPDAIHSHYFSNNGLYLTQAKKKGVSVRISHCHQANPNLKLSKKIAVACSRYLLGRSGSVNLACSNSANEFLYKGSGITYYNSIDYDKHYVIEDKNSIYNKHSLDENKKYVLFVGRMTEQKNPEFLLNLINIYKNDNNISFIVISHGSLLENFKKKIEENGIRNVIYLPKDTNVNEIMNISSCLVLPSKYEGFPITVLEAQASGLACLVSNLISTECDLGGCEFLDLDLNLWENRIDKKISDKNPRKSFYNPELDIKYTSKILGYLYDGLNKDDFVRLGKEYSLGSKNVYRSKELSYLSFKMAKDLGSIRGAFYYALAHFEGNGVAKNKDLALSYLMPYKERLIMSAQNEMKNMIPNPIHLVILADMYSFGFGMNNDFKKAFDLYSKAAELGNLEAMCDLGYMYLVGQGVDRDEEKSFYWFKKSADLGYLHSIRDVGQSYLYGLGTKKNIDEAKRYFKIASDNNYSHGSTDLAKCLIEENSSENIIVDLLLKALKQDYERTFRDLIELGFDINELINNKRLTNDNTTEITRIDDTNTYNGTLYVSSRITYVDPNCFYNAKHIFKIFVEKENPYYKSVAGVLYSKDLKTIIRYPIGLKDNFYEVKDGVEVIGEHAFQNARNLTRIVLPQSITRVLDSAFDDCKLLQDINLVDSIEEISSWAMHGCDSLKFLKLPFSLKKLGTYPFGSCESLKNIEISSENKCFKTVDGALYDSKLERMIQYPIGRPDRKFTVLPTVKRLVFRCFSDAYNLEEIDCSNVLDIEEKVFYYCTNLKSISLNENVKLNGDKIFSHTMIDRK